MEQLRALVWVKWRIFLSQMRSSKAFTGQLLLGLSGGLVALLAIALGATLFGAMYMMATSEMAGRGPISVLDVQLMLLGAIYITWIMAVLLPTRGGGVFEVSHLLHYPLRLGRLFVIDLISEMFKGVTLLLLPTLVAVHLALPAAYGRPLWGVLPLLETLVLGGLVMKTFESVLGLLNRRGRNAAETLASLVAVSIVVGMGLLSGAIPELRRLLEDYPLAGDVLSLTPLFLTGEMIQAAMRGEAGPYWRALGLFSLELPGAMVVCYWLWRRLATGAGAAGRPKSARKDVRQAWLIPGLGDLRSALVEKEIKYLLRNPQVRMLAAMPFMFLMLKWGGTHGSLFRPNAKGSFTPQLVNPAWLPYLDGGLIAGVIAYLLLLYGALFNNMFGLDGHGMKSYLLAPVSRRTLLACKNLSLGLVIGVQGVLLLVFDQLLFGDLRLDTLVTSVLTFFSALLLMAGIGNLVSVSFPRRSEYGKRLEASAWATFLTFVMVPVAMLPSAAGFVAGVWARSVEVKQLVMATGLAVVVVGYRGWLLPRAAERLRARQDQIATTVLGGDE